MIASTMRVYRINDVTLQPGDLLPPESWVKVKDAAAFLGVSQMTVLRHVEEGRLRVETEPSAGRYGHRLFINTSDLNTMKGGDDGLG